VRRRAVELALRVAAIAPAVSNQIASAGFDGPELRRLTDIVVSRAGRLAASVKATAD